MKLTPLDIRHKEFKRGMRGYADVEVDEFLDEVADEYERLFKENIDLQERVEALEEKVAGYKRIEETLQKTLVTAQASAEELKQNASKQAQLILHDAELKARQMVNEAYTEKPGDRAVDGQAQERRAGLPLQVPAAARGLPRAASRRPGAGAGGRRAGSRARPRRSTQHAEAHQGGAIAREACRQPPAAAPDAAEAAPSRRRCRSPAIAPRAGREASSRRAGADRAPAEPRRAIPRSRRAGRRAGGRRGRRRERVGRRRAPRRRTPPRTDRAARARPASARATTCSPTWTAG